MAMPRLHRGFTLVELLVVVAIIALLLGILLPAVRSSSETSKVTVSASNLRQLAAGHASYAAAWSDRQVTLISDQIGSYGTSAPSALDAYQDAVGVMHPDVMLGWGTAPFSGQRVNWHFPPDLLQNHTLLQPIVFRSNDGLQYFGNFRMPNVKALSQYVSGRFYDRVFYAPKDLHVLRGVGQCFEDPGEFCAPDYAELTEEEPFCLHPLVTSNTPVWASYVLSPAAMFGSSVMSSDGFQLPFSLGGGLRSPSYSQTLYPSLKTHMLEHHWLQNTRDLCNPGFVPGTYDNCEPFYYNHSEESSPLALFYDGHVEQVGVGDAQRADGKVQAQSGHGLWSRDTPWGNDGYLSSYGYDQANTSFHVLTTDGIRGRDVTH